MTDFSRIIGRRQPPLAGILRPPTDEERAWVKAMAQRHTCVPRGVFRYRSHTEANADWELWQAAAITEVARLD